MPLNYLKNPSKAVEEIKKGAFLEKSVGVMAISAFIFAINTVIGMNITVTGPQIAASAVGMGTLNLAIGMFFGVLIGGLFMGWIMKLIMNVLGGKGGYFEGLTTIAYPVMAVSVGILIAMLASYIPMIGTVISFVVLAAFFAIGYASMYRFAKELFDTGMIEAFVGISVLFAIVIVAIYGSILTTAAGFKSVLP